MQCVEMLPFWCLLLLIAVWNSILPVRNKSNDWLFDCPLLSNKQSIADVDDRYNAGKEHDPPLLIQKQSPDFVFGNDQIDSFD